MKKLIVLVCILMLLLGMFSLPCQAVESTYIYSYWGEAKASPSAMHTNKVEKLVSKDGTALLEPNDIVCDKNGNIYIADTGNQRIVIFDRDFKYINEIKKFDSNKGIGDTFSSPNSVFVCDDGTIYVADTENSRLVLFNNDCSFKEIISAPKSNLLDDDFVYKPISVAVDSLGRIYVISQNNLLGVMVFTYPDKFDGFIGVQKVSANPLELLWRNFMTEEQIARTDQFVPTEFSSVTLDDEGFIFATIGNIDKNDLYNAITSRSKSGDYLPVKKLNPSGVDVMVRNGFFPPAGDSAPETPDDTSVITDVAVCSNGVYSLLDIKKNRIFTYDEDGSLLYVFGGSGNESGKFQQATALAYNDKDLLVLDKLSGKLTRFEFTEYGKKIDRAITCYQDKNYYAANQIWAEIVNDNNNSDIAYIGLGKASFRNKDYKAAMKYFKIAEDVENYSKSFSMLRKQYISRYFFLIPIGLILIVWLVLFLNKKCKQCNDKYSYVSGKKPFFSKLIYAVYFIFHPFDASYEIKKRDRGSVGSAGLILILATVSYLIFRRFSGYVFVNKTIHSFNVYHEIMTVLIPVFVFTIANWCLTCLMDGEGSFKDIFIAVSYSLTPMVLILPILTVLSRGMVLTEASFYIFLSGLALVWSLFLVFVSNMTIHNFAFGRNVVAILLTIIAMIIIAFLAVLFGVLMQRVFTFIFDLYTEVTYRM